jgi:hypothetical protein
LLPTYSIYFGFGGVPIRYISLFFIARTPVPKSAVYILYLLPVHIIYILLSGFMGRQFHLIDISYLLTYFYMYLLICISHDNFNFFAKCIGLFLAINIIYSIVQNIALNLGVDSSLLLLHQNTHEVDYKIPSSVIPYLWRVTGLFNESVPYVIYLMFTLIYYIVINGSKLYKSFCLIALITSGAKISLIFIALYLFLLLMKHKLKIYRVEYWLVFIIVSYYLSAWVVVYLNSEPSLYSITLRLQGLLGSVDSFFNNQAILWFGAGFVSSSELMSSNYDGIPRGTDYFSMFIYSNGIIGLLLLNFPIYLYFKSLKLKFFVFEKNILFISLFLSLLTAGTYTAFNYSYLILLLYLMSKHQQLNEARN